jgi:putative phosphoesterase
MVENAIIIGLVSDTHALVRNSIFEALAGVSLILHAGDVGGDPVLDALSSIAPVRAVSGNVDPWNPRLEDRVYLSLGGVSIHMTHGHELGSPTAARLLARYQGDVLVYGHTHRALVHRDGARLVINPGSAGPRRFDLSPSVAKLTIAGGLAQVEIVELSD